MRNFKKYPNYYETGKNANKKKKLAQFKMYPSPWPSLPLVKGSPVVSAPHFGGIGDPTRGPIEDLNYIVKKKAIAKKYGRLVE